MSLLLYDLPCKKAKVHTYICIQTHTPTPTTPPPPTTTHTDDGEPNFDPRVCMSLASQALQSMGLSASAANARLLVGAELGAQYGACNGMSFFSCVERMHLLHGRICVRFLPRV